MNSSQEASKNGTDMPKNPEIDPAPSSAKATPNPSPSDASPADEAPLLLPVVSGTRKVKDSAESSSAEASAATRDSSVSTSVSAPTIPAISSIATTIDDDEDEDDDDASATSNPEHGPIPVEMLPEVAEPSETIAIVTKAGLAQSVSESSLKPMEGYVGRIAVGGAFGLLLISVLMKWPVAVTQILLSGFIGGFTNTVAIHMLFTRVWYLPGSGVMLKRKDAIILTLADTMQEHILNPSLIEERVRALSSSVNPERVLEGVNALISELRTDAIDFVQAPEQREMITEAVRKEGGFWGDMADAVGVVTYDKVADRIVGGLIKQLEAFRVDRTMLDAATDYAGSFESFLLEPGNPLIRRHYKSERSVAQILFEKLDARQLVIDKLSSYEAEQIRDIVSENIKDHLAWLEVFGVILGMIISALILSIGALL